MAALIGMPVADAFDPDDLTRGVRETSVRGVGPLYLKSRQGHHADALP
jgi:hypothetical protein